MKPIEGLKLLRLKYIELLEFEETRLELMKELAPEPENVKFYIDEIKKWHKQMQSKMELLNDLISIQKKNKKDDQFLSWIYEE